METERLTLKPKLRLGKFEEETVTRIDYVVEAEGGLFTIVIKRGDTLNSAKEKGQPALRTVTEEHGVDRKSEPKLPGVDDR